MEWPEPKETSAEEDRCYASIHRGGSRLNVERARRPGRSDPERWRAVMAAWERLEHPFEAAGARFRLTEALLAGGSPAGRPRQRSAPPTRRRSRSG